MDRFDLAESAQKLVTAYSGGMRRKLDLAMTLVGQPSDHLPGRADDRTDPRSRRTMRGIIRGLVADGVTVFLTTQYLEEADQLANRVAVLDHGHLVAQGTPDELKRQVPGTHVRLRFTDVAELDAAARVLTDSTRVAGVTGELAAADGVGLLDPGFLSRTVRVIAEGTRRASGTLKASKACSVINEEK